MSLTKRRISRRALGVVVGASLLVLGLEAPALAAPPVISGFSPDSGDDAGGCIVVVTGTGLDDFADDAWAFVPPGGGAGTAAPDAVLVSDTEAWVTLPAGLTAGTAYNIRITNAGGTQTNTSTGTFLVTTGAGNCAPTITTITPDCGSHNDRVVIAGTNLLADPTPLAAGEDIAGGAVRFTPFATDAAVVPPDSDTATQLTRFVSADAADGPVRVTAGGGVVHSTQSFAVPPPDCPTGAEQHARSISLTLKRHLIARGTVTVEDDTAECMAGVPVKIQRRKKGGGWKNVGSTTTTDAGKYKRAIKDRPGKYRAVAPAVTLADNSVCSKDVSPRVRHSH